MKRMWTEPTVVVTRPWWAVLNAKLDPMLFALACAMLAVLLYAAGTFAVRTYTDDERYDNPEPVPIAQTW